MSDSAHEPTVAEVASSESETSSGEAARPVSARSRRSMSATNDSVLADIVSSIRASQVQMTEPLPSSGAQRASRRVKHLSSSAIPRSPESNTLLETFPHVVQTERSERPRLTKQITSQHLSRENSSGSERSIHIREFLPSVKISEAATSTTAGMPVSFAVSPKKSLTRRSAFYPNKVENSVNKDDERADEGSSSDVGSGLDSSRGPRQDGETAAKPMGLGTFLGLSTNEVINFRKRQSVTAPSEETADDTTDGLLMSLVSRRSQRSSSKRSTTKVKLMKSSVSSASSTRSLSDSRRSEKLVKSRKKGPRESIMERLAAGVFGEERGGSDSDRVVLQRGTLDDFFMHILTHDMDSLTIQHMILAHRHVVSSALFIRHIMLAFDRARELDGNDTNKSTAQMRVLNVMKHWMKLDMAGLKGDPETLSFLSLFIQTVDKSSMVGASFASLMKSKLNDLSNVKENDSKTSGPPGESANAGAFKLDVMAYLPEEFAAQMCLFDQELLSEIPLDEYLRTRWIKNEAPAVRVFSEYSNKFSQYLTVQIATPLSIPTRIAVFSQVVAIGRCLLDLFDFTGLLIVFLALQHTLVDKIYKVISKDLPKDVRHDYEDILEVMTPLSNFQNYRKFIKVTSGPHVPCLEVHLKDLLYTAEGNEDYVDKEKTVLNLGKLDSLGKIISILYLAPKAETFKFARNEDLQRELSALASMPPQEIAVQIDVLYRRDQRLNASISKIEVDLPEATKPKIDPIDPRTAFQSMPANPAEQILFLTHMFDSLKAFQTSLNEREEAIGDLELQKLALLKAAEEITLAYEQITSLQKELGQPVLASQSLSSLTSKGAALKQLQSEILTPLSSNAPIARLDEEEISVDVDLGKADTEASTRK